MPEVAKNPAIHEVGKLSSPHDAAGEVIRRKMTMAKAQPPPAFIGTKGNYDTSRYVDSISYVGAYKSTMSNCSEHSTICGLCGSDSNASNGSHYYSLN